MSMDFLFSDRLEGYQCLAKHSGLKLSYTKNNLNFLILYLTDH